MTTSANSEAVVSNNVDSPLPNFVQKRAEGIFVDPSRIPAAGGFQVFLERLYSQGARFAGLDYACLQQLLYPTGASESQRGVVRLAAEIVVFPAARNALYKEVRLIDQGAQAEYMFEPALLEVQYQQPLYGDADASGVTPIVGYEDRTRLEPTQLDFDEFVAAMWTKGVRFGIQVRAVQSAISANKADRCVVACELTAKPGHDAELREECKGLHRDNSPMITAGKADLRRFKNRFPQITKGQRMMKKVPLQLGETGYKVTGDLIEPALPKDVDLNAIAGPGTRIEASGDEQFIVAVADGFISIDVDSNQISVTEKIESKGGISARTTGDLLLSVDEFIEHGEVQEGRVVEGKHMTFTSTVYGSLVSDGGRLELHDNLSGGSATSPNGSITIKKRASNARLEAVGGRIDVHYAENSTIIGDDVTLEHAINCQVVADSVHMGLAQGCAIAARSIAIDKTDSRKGSATVVSVLVPDPAEALGKLATLGTALAELERLVQATSAQMQTLQSEPELAKFLSIRAMVQAGKVTVSPALAQNFRLMQSKHAPALKAMEKLASDQKAALQSIAAKREEMQQLKAAQHALAVGRGCTIGEVLGETTVQQLRTNQGVANFAGTSGNELGAMLRAGTTPLRVYSDDHGSVDWHYAAVLPED